MSIDYPTLEEAEKIWQEGMDYKLKVFGSNSDNYIVHSKEVAIAAKKIAAKTLYLNPEKAYILGLLHDYGRRIKEKEVGRFHGQEGYDEMVKKGYLEVARICLTHTFPNKNFNNDDFSYREEWLDWARSKLKDIEYNDYDRLIQLCDKMCELKEKTTIECRVAGIVRRYNLPEKQHKLLLKEGLELKSYFDKICNEDVYKIVGIES